MGLYKIYQSKIYEKCIIYRFRAKTKSLFRIEETKDIIGNT